MSSRESILLLLGDTVVFALSLWLTLLVRYQELPAHDLLASHIPPFTILFGVWVLVFFIAGLYERRSLFLRRRQTSTIIIAHTTNIALAALFFFSFSYFGITPKTNLAIYLGISSVLMLLWRLYISHLVGARRSKNALLIGSGKEVEELHVAIDRYPNFGLRILHSFAPEEVVHSDSLQDNLLAYLDKENIEIIIADMHHPLMKDLLPVLYNVSFLHNKVAFVDTAQLYEDVFNRVPISLLNEAWFLRYITRQSKIFYSIVHRLIDIVAGVCSFLVFLCVLPFVWVAIYREDRGPLFVYQERVGRYNTPLNIIKFRSMTGSDKGDEVLQSVKRVTRVGTFLRKTRLDELPQSINLLKGEVSFIGPRPELPALSKAYAEQIPYYNARHLVKPGLSGWAQIYHEAHPHHGIDVTETTTKLSYDLYYVKHRSILLDIVIALRTIHTLLSRTGM